MDIDLNLGELYLPLDRTNNEIRLLKLSGPQDGSLIRCHLETFKLDEAPVFTALSYSWGNPSSQHRISLDGHVDKVTANLHRLLKSLTTLHSKNKRNPQEWLWIDALCIDQDSLEERGNQVQLFSRIYSRAEEVLAWLGPGSHNSDRCVKALARDPSYWQSQRRLLWFWKNGAGHGAVEICRKRYWSRLWTFQELLNAKRILLLCGLRYIAWDSFVGNLSSLLAIQRLPQRHEHVRDSVNGSPAVSRLAQGHGHRRYRTVFMAMKETTHLECSLAHDRVYALLGVVDSKIQTAYDMPLAVLLNSVLREHHTFARPDTCDSVMSDCKDLCEMLNMDLASIFDCLNGWGSQAAPSKADVELMPLSEQGSHCSLWWATFYGHRCVQDLLFQNAIITEGDVVRACKVGRSAALVTIFKAAPFNCNRIREEGKTLMSLAISYGHAAVVRCLLDTPAYQIGSVSETRPGIETFSSFDEKGRTYLTHAIRKGNGQIVQLLLRDQRCDPNAKEQSGLTALHAAVLYGPLDVIRQLLDSGRCNIYSRDGKDRTALSLALSEFKEVRWAMKTSWSERRRVHDRRSKRQEHLQQQYEKLGFVINLLHRQESSFVDGIGGETTIGQAAALGISKSIIQKLLKFGAPADTADEDGQTPTHGNNKASPLEEETRNLSSRYVIAFPKRSIN